MEERTVNIFDFDGTLFKSPAPNPDLWDGMLLGLIKGKLQWFQDIITLSEPYIPAKITDEWFVESVKEKVLESMENPSAVTVLLTGRTKIFESQINRILKAGGLVFDEIGLKPNGNITTTNFKYDFISHLVSKYSPNKICIWEDRSSYADKFRSFLKQKYPRIDSKIILLQSAETYLTLQSELEIIDILSKNTGQRLYFHETTTFTGVFLDEESR
jgi:hypothetical protein